MANKVARKSKKKAGSRKTAQKNKTAPKKASKSASKTKESEAPVTKMSKASSKESKKPSKANVDDDSEDFEDGDPDGDDGDDGDYDGEEPDELPRGQLGDFFICGPNLISLVIDVDQLTVQVSTTDEKRAKKKPVKFPTFDALCAGYPAIWQAAVDESGDEPRTMTHDEAVPMDIHAAWVRQERRANARAAHDDGVWTGKLAAARAVLEKFTGQKAAQAAVPERMRRDFDFSGKGLAKSLTYAINIERTPDRLPIAKPSKAKKPKDTGAQLPLGVSKIGGWPHLPPELAWPEVDGEPLYLFAQLSLAEIAAADVSGSVPARGMLYLFITHHAHATLIYTEATNLELREPPTAQPDYMTKLVNNEQRLTFTPTFYFRQETGDTHAPFTLLEALPAKLREDVGKVLGCSPKPTHVFSGDRIFGGDPVDWQAMYQSYLKNELFAQLDYSEGHISIGVDPDDLRAGVFDDADCSYCGT